MSLEAGERLLIFPAGMPQALAFQRRCRRDGVPTVGASSLLHDTSREHYGEWHFLPYVVDPGFSVALLQLVQRHRITGIYTPNLVVWDHLAAVLPRLAPGVRLVNASPATELVETFLAARRRADALQTQPLELGAVGSAGARAPVLAMAGMLRAVDQVPGMCDHDKISALAEVARHVAAGDIVEIGSWWGKSAVLLALLSRQHGLGALLCVDPWRDENLLQADAPLVDQTANRLSAELAFDIFCMNLAPVAGARANYLRMLSTDAALVYARSAAVTSQQFGTTPLAGTIALLHIDGNHDRSAVQADIDAWSPHVRPDGGWIVFDDYVWPYGDGPQHVADAWYAANHVRIACAFVMGSALFVQLSD